MKAYWGSGVIALYILDLGTRWRWMVSFTPWPLNPQGKSPWYPLDRRLGGPQSRYDCSYAMFKIKNIGSRTQPAFVTSSVYGVLQLSWYRVHLDISVFRNVDRFDTARLGILTLCFAGDGRICDSDTPLMDHPLAIYIMMMMMMMMMTMIIIIINSRFRYILTCTNLLNRLVTLFLKTIYKSVWYLLSSSDFRLRSQESSANVETRLPAGWAGFDYRQGQWCVFFSSPPRPERPWSPLSLLSNEYQWLFPWW
jgi:hypothetical protein